MPLTRTLRQPPIVNDSIRVAPSPNATPSEASSGQVVTRDVFPWRVVHACEQARDVLTLVQSQLTVGMRPFVVTSRGNVAKYYYRSRKEKIHAALLLQAWSDVRDWKRLLIESDPERTTEIVHAHSFAAGMAALRADAPLVYDVHQSAEPVATEDKSWLGRSFRVAQQFVLISAGAVVVHSNNARQECIRIGVEESSLFCIPQPIDPALLESVPDRRWIEQRIGANGVTTIFFAPELSKGPERELQISTLLTAFACTYEENENVKLILLQDKDDGAIRQHPEIHKLRRMVHLLPPADRDLVFASCDVVIVCDSFDEDSQALLLVEALARGRALLATNNRNSRDSIPARSCLWFGPGPRELGQRMSFLARNPDFCRMISSNGHGQIASARSPQVIGRLCHEVYTQVAAKKKQTDAKSNDIQLIPLQVNL